MFNMRHRSLDTLRFLFLLSVVIYFGYAIIDMVASEESLSEEYPNLLFGGSIFLLWALVMRTTGSLFAQNQQDTGLAGPAKLLAKAAMPLAAVFFVAAVIVLVIALGSPPGNSWLARHGVFAAVSLAFCAALLFFFRLATRPAGKDGKP